MCKLAHTLCDQQGRAGLWPCAMAQCDETYHIKVKSFWEMAVCVEVTEQWQVKHHQVPLSQGVRLLRQVDDGGLCLDHHEQTAGDTLSPDATVPEALEREVVRPTCWSGIDLQVGLERTESSNCDCSARRRSFRCMIDNSTHHMT